MEHQIPPDVTAGLVRGGDENRERFGRPRVQNWPPLLRYAAPQVVNEEVLTRKQKHGVNEH